jgi:hypothetical protein
MLDVTSRSLTYHRTDACRLRKSSNVVDAGRLKAKENAEEAAKEEAKAKARGPTGKRTALDRFA